MRRVAVVLALGAWLAAVPAVAAAAESCSDYRSEADVVLNVNTGLGGAWSGLLGGVSSGQTTFQAQEQAHEAACGASGASVPHGYVWVAVDGYRLLAVDPPVAYYNYNVK